MMLKKKPNNLTILETATYAEIAQEIGGPAHFTNGTFTLDPEKTIPTTIAAFEYQKNTAPDLPMVLAVNSDKSMATIDRANGKSQLENVFPVATELALFFRENRVIVIFYDEETPRDLYQQLEKFTEYGLITETLFKWGYGLGDGPKIEGKECFKYVFASPLPNDEKPVCFYSTNRSDNSNITEVNLIERARDLAKSQEQAKHSSTLGPITGFFSEHRSTVFSVVGVTVAAAMVAYMASSSTDEADHASYSP